MKSNMGLLMNIVLGIIGVQLMGWTSYLIAGFIGANVLIAIGRAIRGQPALPPDSICAFN